MTKKLKIKHQKIALVLGGAGFIGSHLVDALILRGYKVRVLDNLSPPAHDGKLPEWFNKKAQFIKGDVRSRKDMERALRGVSYVFHLAAYMDYHMDFSTYFSVNTESVALLYEIIVAKKLPIKKIILASSQSVYGDGKYKCSKHGDVYASSRPEAQLKKKDWTPRCSCGRRFVKPIREREEDEFKPQNPYGVSKMALEYIALNLGRKYKIPTVIVRYSIVHGPRQSWKHFYSGALRSFAVQALAGEPIEMHEDARQTRDFVHTDDVTSAHLLLMKSPKSNYEIFNIGSGRKDVVIQLAQAVCKAVGTPLNADIKGLYRIGTPRDSLMDISKLKKLGWKPTKTLEDNARDYVDWVRQFPEAIKHLRKTYRDMKKKKTIQ
jgi:dTDP-L-rhamnose 4-epimerase